MTDELAWRQYERARRFELQGRVEEATAAYEAAVALQPGFPEAYFALGRIIASEGRTEAALPLLDRAVAARPDPEILEWRAFVLGRLRRFEAALDDYRRVVEAGETQARVNLGRMLLALRRFDEAEAELARSDDPAAAVLLDALPRYREFRPDESVDDLRAGRYLFARCIILGTAGDGLRLRSRRYLLLTSRHVAVIVQRFAALAAAEGWVFDAVAGDHVHHAPVADLVAATLGLPRIQTPTAGARILLCSAVVDGLAEARKLRRPLERAKARVMHFALAFVPHEPPDLDEPEVVGVVARAAVSWYRVAEWSRMEPDPDAGDGPTSFRVGLPFVDPNRRRLASVLSGALAAAPEDPFTDEILDWYRARHPQARAIDWGDEP